MPRKLPLDDFRAVRVMLEAEDFAYAPGEPNPESEDLVDGATWSDLITLPDTVAFFTSNNHGRELHLMSQLWGECIQHLASEVQDETFYGMMSASDEFQAATFNALSGYYRVSIDCLRSALESLTVTTYCQAYGSKTEFAEWQTGQRDIGFGTACDKLTGAPCVQPLTTFLTRECGTDLFRQRQEGTREGWVRVLYSGLSDYSHSRPGFEAGHMWGGSDGPIYEKSAFRWTHRLWLQTLGTCFILVKLARPATPLTLRLQSLFKEGLVREICVLEAAARYLWA